MTDKQLMRETVGLTYGGAANGALNAVFGLDIPENYAMELDRVEFLINVPPGQVGNRWQFFLVDDPDETANPGHGAEKVIQSAVLITEFTTEGRYGAWMNITLDCSKTLLVQNPNFIADLNTVMGGSGGDVHCRIWFDFVKISPREILDLLRQMQY